MNIPSRSETLREIFDYPGERSFTYGQIVELTFLMSEILEPLEFAALSKEYFDKSESTSWQRLQLIGGKHAPVMMGEELLKYFSSSAIEKLRTPKVKSRVLEIICRSSEITEEVTLL